MKILATGDLHYRPHWFAWLKAEAPHYDAVCLAGDLLDMLEADDASLRRQADWVVDWIRSFPAATPLIVVTGNHDVWEDEARYQQGAWLQRARRRGVAVDGDVVTVGDMTFACQPWFGTVAPPATGRVILVAHAPPEGTPVALGFDGDFGDFEVRDLACQLSAGSLVLSGHVHRPKAWFARVGRSTCLNPGCDLRAPIPHHLVIDTVRQRVELRHHGRRPLVPRCNPKPVHGLPGGLGSPSRHPLPDRPIPRHPRMTGFP
jgi:Icc-related predicted phosphoesterase